MSADLHPHWQRHMKRAPMPGGTTSVYVGIHPDDFPRDPHEVVEMFMSLPANARCLGDYEGDGWLAIEWDEKHNDADLAQLETKAQEQADRAAFEAWKAMKS